MGQIHDLESVLKKLARNAISVAKKRGRPEFVADGSRMGGKPYLPGDFVWPRFHGEAAELPLSFLCQFDLREIKPYDSEQLLPTEGLLSFFYEQETQCWGFDPEDRGCARVYYFEKTDGFVLTEFPEDLSEEYRLPTIPLTFSSQTSYPNFEELDCHADIKGDWDDYDKILEEWGVEIECERHKLLGYADLIQGEMLTECERTSRGLYCGDAKSYQKTPQEVKDDIAKKATDWILLFQMASFTDGDNEVMWGDCGNLYFYIRRQDLRARNFDNVWLVLQCG